MKKHLLATTAAIAVLAGPIALSPAAFAQEGEQVQQNAEAQNENRLIFNQDSQYEGQADGGFYSADPNQILASQFIGASIYSGAGEEAEAIGDVNDVIMTPDGRAVAVIAGVGGFLGLGEKEVAVSIDQLQWKPEENGDRVLVSELSREQLETAPEFDRDALSPDEQMASDSQQQNDQQMAQDEQPAAEQDQQTVDAEQQATEEDQQMAEGSGSQDEMTTASTRPMETVSAADARLEATEIVGMTVNSADDEAIGEVSEILIGEDGKVEAFIVDVGGFLGINEKPVAVSFDQLKFARAEGAEEWSTIQTGLTTEQLENSKAFSKETYASEPGTVTLDAPVGE